MSNLFHHHMPVNIFFGTGIVEEKLGLFLKESQNVLVICDPFLDESGKAKSITTGIDGCTLHFFSEIEPNPSCDTVDRAVALARELQADCVIGLGGGSALDVSKITACLAGTTGSIYDYYAGGTQQLPRRTTRLICIPTTAGTGSEVTNVGVFTDRKTGRKAPMVNDEFWADTALLDPRLTYTLPPAVTASTGMDAFCHAIEAYWNRESQPVSDWLAMGAMKLILENIKTAWASPENEGARGNMLLASLLAGIAFSQTRTTGIHALSFPLTAEFGVSHGAACAVTLPAFIRLNAGEGGEKTESLARFLGDCSVEDLADRVERLMESMDMATRLNQFGITSADIEHIAEVGLSAAIIHLTPAKMDQETVCRLLGTIL